MTFEKNTTILSIDPGKHVGVCLLDLRDTGKKNPWLALGTVNVTGSMLTTYHGDDAIIELIKLFDSISKSKNPLVITVEHFVFTRVSMMGGSHNALEITGVVKALSAIYTPNAVVHTFQKPAEAKLVSLDVLEELAIKIKGDKTDDHAHMAARHALVMASRIRKGKVVV